MAVLPSTRGNNEEEEEREMMMIKIRPSPVLDIFDIHTALLPSLTKRVWSGDPSTQVILFPL